MPGPRSFQGVYMPGPRSLSGVPDTGVSVYQRGWAYQRGVYQRGLYQRGWAYQRGVYQGRVGIHTPHPPDMGLGYSWQVGGTHPTGMLSCVNIAIDAVHRIIVN